MSTIEETAPLVHPAEWDSPEKLRTLIEGALFSSEQRLTVKDIQALFPELFQPNVKEIEECLEQLKSDYKGRAVALHSSAQGWRFQIRPHGTPLIRSMLTIKPPKFSRASLETLALIAYRQPITRGEIEEIRGVSVSSQIIRTFEERGWVRVVGHKEVPGRPALWATTAEFLDYFDLGSLEQLPALAEMPNFEDSLEGDTIDILPAGDGIIKDDAMDRPECIQADVSDAPSESDVTSDADVHAVSEEELLDPCEAAGTPDGQYQENQASEEPSPGIQALFARLRSGHDGGGTE